VTRLKSEAGFGETLLAVLVTIGIAGVALGLATIQDLADLKNGNWNKKPESTGSAGAVAQAPFIGSAPWRNDDQKNCVLTKAGAAGLTWGAKGWRAPTVYPEPQIAGDYRVDQGALSAWSAQVESDSQGNTVNTEGRFSAGTGGDVILRGTKETTFSGGTNRSCGYDLFGKKRSQ
jgi:hypothetical protein